MLGRLVHLQRIGPVPAQRNDLGFVLTRLLVHQDVLPQDP